MTAPRVVVGAAILRDGRVLAARRTSPPAAAGRWELPGGKVEPGETPDAAVVREIAEELGAAVAVTGWLDVETQVSASMVLRVATVVLVDGEPAPTEHDALRWLGTGELDDVDWLEPDRPFLPSLRTVLERHTGAVSIPRPRGIFFEEDAARAVVARLRRDGFDAELERERLAGEDDDDDHPWAVLTSAPEVVLDLLCDEHDGWLDHGEPDGPPPAPLVLPAAPRRIKRE